MNALIPKPNSPGGDPSDTGMPFPDARPDSA